MRQGGLRGRAGRSADRGPRNQGALRRRGERCGAGVEGVCFSRIGVVFGNIVQSTRGVISVLLSAAVGAAGLVLVEEKATGARLLWKAGAALAMGGAIALYYLGA